MLSQHDGIPISVTKLRVTIRAKKKLDAPVGAAGEGNGEWDGDEDEDKGPDGEKKVGSDGGYS